MIFSYRWYMKRNLFVLCCFFMLFLGLMNISAQSNVYDIANQKNEDIVAYPNPTKDVISIRPTQAGVRVKMVVFYDILGTQVASFSAHGVAVELDISRLKPGKYLMKYVLSDNTQKIKQIIKQ